MKISDIKNELDKLGPEEYRAFIDMYNSDDRKGVKKIVKTAENRLNNYTRLRQWNSKLVDFDKSYSAERVIGVDEAGRGPLFGPVVAAAVVIDNHEDLVEVYDSKSLSEVTRERLYDIIIDKALCYGVGVVSAGVIDEIGILNATKLAMNEAVSKIDRRYKHVLVDYVDIEFNDREVFPIIKGDTKSFSIAAASIIAKVYRDRLIRKLAEEYDYDLLNNKGYGTKKHYDLLKKNGLSVEHRKSFLRGWNEYIK